MFIIVVFFIICWTPLYTINTVLAFCEKCAISLEATLLSIILSHANSAVNPFLYAFYMKDFRAGIKNLFGLTYDDDNAIEFASVTSRTKHEVANGVGGVNGKRVQHVHQHESGFHMPSSNGVDNPGVQMDAMDNLAK